MIVKAVVDRSLDSDLGSGLKYFPNTNTIFSLNTPGNKDCIVN